MMRPRTMDPSRKFCIDWERRVSKLVIWMVFSGLGAEAGKRLRIRGGSSAAGFHYAVKG